MIETRPRCGAPARAQTQRWSAGGGRSGRGLGGGGQTRDAEEGDEWLGDVPHEGEGEVGVHAEKALQGLRRGKIQPPHVRLRPRDRQP
jgi:hypothetical protein